MKSMVKTADVVNSNLWKLFPAINVDRTKDIPADYLGVMGVPISFIDKYSSTQFDIVGITKSGTSLENGRIPYRRLLIRHLHPELPEEIDLKELLAKCGVDLDIELLVTDDCGLGAVEVK